MERIVRRPNPGTQGRSDGLPSEADSQAHSGARDDPPGVPQDTHTRCYLCDNRGVVSVPYQRGLRRQTPVSYSIPMCGQCSKVTEYYQTITGEPRASRR